MPTVVLSILNGSSSLGAQWLSGRVLDLRPKGSPASLRCVLEQDH